MRKARKVSSLTLAWNHTMLEGFSVLALVAEGVNECLFRVRRSFCIFLVLIYKIKIQSLMLALLLLEQPVLDHTKLTWYSSVCCLHLNSVFKKRNN